MTAQNSGGGAGSEERKEPGVDPVLQGSIGRKLRDTYQEVVNEQVPEKFLALLQELKKKETDSGDGAS